MSDERGTSGIVKTVLIGVATTVLATIILYFLGFSDKGTNREIREIHIIGTDEGGSYKKSSRDNWWCCNPATGGTPLCPIVLGKESAVAGASCWCAGFVGTGYACLQ